MARINFEDSVFTTPQWNKLIVSIAKKYAHCDLDEFQELAKGRLHTVWRLAQDYWIENRTLIPEKVWSLIPYHQDMIDCGFAEKRESGIYIYGSEEQFEWLISRRESGRKGGLKRQANLKKRDEANSSNAKANLDNAILIQNEAHFELDDVPWPDEQDEKISTIQNDAIYQDEDLSTFGQNDSDYREKNPSNAKANSSNAKANSSNAKANSSKSNPLTPTLPPKSESEKTFSKKEKEEKLIEASTNFVYEEKSPTIDEEFDEARYRYMKKFESIVDFEIRPSQMDKLRYSQLIKSGITHGQVLTMIDNYANYKLPQCKPGHYPIHRKFETFLGSPVNWVCKEYLESMADKVKAKRAAAKKAEDAERDRKIAEDTRKRREEIVRKQATQALEIEAAIKAKAKETRSQEQIAVDALGTFVLDIPFSDPKGLQKAGDILNGMNLRF